jgi:hypothetical protein
LTAYSPLQPYHSTLNFSGRHFVPTGICDHILQNIDCPLCRFQSTNTIYSHAQVQVSPRISHWFQNLTSFILVHPHPTRKTHSQYALGFRFRRRLSTGSKNQISSILVHSHPTHLFLASIHFPLTGCSTTSIIISIDVQSSSSVKPSIYHPFCRCVYSIGHINLSQLDLCLRVIGWRSEARVSYIKDLASLDGSIYACKTLALSISAILLEFGSSPGYFPPTVRSFSVFPGPSISGLSSSPEIGFCRMNYTIHCLCLRHYLASGRTCPATPLGSGLRQYFLKILHPRLMR